MSKFICSINGVRGRKMKLYDNKCVIITEPTLGSVITNNATDGEKTIFYIDVTGVQFKESGIAIGYLQLETSSGQMNNQTSNFFSENTFTFSDNNNYMRKVYEFVVARIEGYKYGTITEAPTEIPKLTESERMAIEREHRAIKEKELEEEKKERELQRIQEEKEATEKRVQDMIENIQQSSTVESTILAFVNQASECTSFVQLLKLWTEIPEECKAPYYEIQKKLEESATVERFYGRSEKNVENFIVWIKEIFEVS